jgi:GT2 family glycosyltransferase
MRKTGMEAEMHNTVAVIVVTYNRQQLLTECLDALLAQSRVPDRLILIDNASTDGTAERLQAAGYLANPRMAYTRLAENTGGAGGFHEGMKQGLEAGYDWLWVMDDDTAPAPDALERLLDFQQQHPAVEALASLPVSLDQSVQYRHRGWIKPCQLSNRVIVPITAEDVAQEYRVIGHCSFVGLMVSARLAQQTGLPRKDFFIHYDDYEYCARLAKRAEIYLVPASIIIHKEERLDSTELKSSWFGTSPRIPFAKLWLRYYPLRNLIYLKKTQCSPVVALLYGCGHVLRVAAGILLYDDHKWLRIKFHLHAFIDGMRGHFDNQKPVRLCAPGLPAGDAG